MDGGRIVIEIDLGNDAMRTASDVSNAVQKALTRGGGGHSLYVEPLSVGNEGRVMDDNGNTVGKWAVS